MQTGQQSGHQQRGMTAVHAAGRIQHTSELDELQVLEVPQSLSQLGQLLVNRSK